MCLPLIPKSLDKRTLAGLKAMNQPLKARAETQPSLALAGCWTNTLRLEVHMSHKKKWSELSSTEQTVILTVGSVELAITATAAVDLAIRPKQDVHGNRVLWALALFVQPVGPIAYLWTHRR